MNKITNKLDENNSNDDNKIKINPYNNNNKLISQSDILTILSEYDIDIKINYLSIYQLSFIHKSYCHKSKNKVDNETDNIEIVEKPEDSLSLFEKSNETLEFLGDAVVNFIVGAYVYERFPNENEGFLTRLRTRLVNGNTLGNLSQKIGLSKFVIISRHVEERCSGRSNLRILEDVFESFVGALFLDNDSDSLENNICLIEKLNDLKKYTKSKILIDKINNIIDWSKILNFKGNQAMEICKKFVINVIEQNIDFTELITNDDNFKDQLLRYFQHNFNETPKYIEIDCNGPPHDRQFTMAVLNIDGSQICSATEKTKKKAEQLASKKALIYFNVLKQT